MPISDGDCGATRPMRLNVAAIFSHDGASTGRALLPPISARRRSTLPARLGANAMYAA